MSGFSPEQLQRLARKPHACEESRLRASSGGYFKTVADLCFQTLNDGTKVFYPHGVFGRRGYVVESQRDEDRLRQRAKAEIILLIVTTPVLASAYGAFLRGIGVLRFVLLMLGLSAAGWLVTELTYWPLTRRLERSHVPNSPIVCWKRMGRTAHPAWLILGASFFACVSAMGFLLFAREGQAVGILIGLMLILFGFPYGVALRSWWRQRTD